MESYIESIKKQFLYYKKLGDKAMEQLDDSDLFWQYNEECNSIAVLVHHISGNMLSRFTDLLNSDGEKPWRNRDAEFQNITETREELLSYWRKGWECLFSALDNLRYEDLESIIYIRNEGHTVVEAINRQLAHYPYHIGQLVYVAKMIKNEKWQTLSIPRSKSSEYNDGKFSQQKARRHFTDNP